LQFIIFKPDLVTPLIHKCTDKGPLARGNDLVLFRKEYFAYTLSDRGYLHQVDQDQECKKYKHSDLAIFIKDEEIPQQADHREKEKKVLMIGKEHIVVDVDILGFYIVQKESEDEKKVQKEGKKDAGNKCCDHFVCHYRILFFAERPRR
jgi:hypothetical protein